MVSFVRKWLGALSFGGCSGKAWLQDNSGAPFPQASSETGCQHEDMSLVSPGKAALSPRGSSPSVAVQRFLLWQDFPPGPGSR